MREGFKHNEPADIVGAGNQHMSRIGHTDLDVFPLCLGGDVFGWTADEASLKRLGIDRI